MTGLSELPVAQDMAANSLGADIDQVTGKLRSNRRKRKVDGILQPRERDTLQRTPGSMLDNGEMVGGLAGSILERPRRGRGREGY